MLNLVLKPHRTHLKAQTTEPQKLFVMLRCIPERTVAQTRPPLALALVIDTSSSMMEEVDNTTKLERAIQAAHRVVDDPALSPEDKITIINFDNESYVLLPLSPLSHRAQAHQVIETLWKYSGGTYMGKGLRNALNQLGMEPPDVTKRLILLTDGLTFDEEDCRDLAIQLAEANTPIIAIGIGEEYNQDLLIELSDTTKGRHFHLQDIQQLENLFSQEVQQAVREVVTDLRLKVQTVRGVNLEAISRVYPSIVEVPLGEQPYRLGNIPAGDYTVFILEFTVSGIPRPPSRARLAQFILWASVPGLKQRQIEFPPKELFVTFTDDETAIAQVEPEVLEYVQQKNTGNLLDQATRLAAQGRTQEARRTLQLALQTTQRLNNPAATRLIQNALEELNRTGTLSENTRRTLRAGGRTMTVKSRRTEPIEGLSEEEIRKITGA
jgi:Ca-activated chloride channel family protein